MSSQIQPPLPRRSPSGFTLVELLVVIGIIALLISILLPSLGKARRAAIAIKCQSNLHQIGLGLAQYAAFNKGSLPYGYYCGQQQPLLRRAGVGLDHVAGRPAERPDLLAQLRRRHRQLRRQRSGRHR
jgi:prepilin-type N-terminal cleavage/methylation domain-containing protein